MRLQPDGSTMRSAVTTVQALASQLITTLAVPNGLGFPATAGRPALADAIKACTDESRMASDIHTLPDVWTLGLQVHTLDEGPGGPIAAPALLLTHEADAVDVAIAIVPVVDEGSVVGYATTAVRDLETVPVLAPTAPAAVAQPFAAAVTDALTQARVIASARDELASE